MLLRKVDQNFFGRLDFFGAIRKKLPKTLINQEMSTLTEHSTAPYSMTTQFKTYTKGGKNPAPLHHRKRPEFILGTNEAFHVIESFQGSQQ